jgi:hypothetical protein
MDCCIQRTPIIPNRDVIADAGQRRALNQFIDFKGRRIAIALPWAFSSNAVLRAKIVLCVDPFYCNSQDTNPFRAALGSMKISFGSFLLPN